MVAVLRQKEAEKRTPARVDVGKKESTSERRCCEHADCITCEVD